MPNRVIRLGTRNAGSGIKKRASITARATTGKCACLSGASMKLVYISFLLTFFYKDGYRDNSTLPKSTVYGKASELSCAGEISTVKVAANGRPTRKRRIKVVSDLVKYTAILRLTKDILFVNVLVLCGDIALNPGPDTSNFGFGRNGLNVCHWNVQHLTDSKLEEIRVMFLKPNNNLDILILTETFCSSKVPDSFYYTPGYQIYRRDRSGKTGGGILAFVNNSITAERRIDYEETDVESLWLEICPHKSRRSLLIAGVYRPPSYKVADDSKLGKNIENAYMSNKEIIVLGDFNIDFLNAGKFKNHSLVTTLRNLNMSQIVNEITRPVSGTCLDHIWSSHPEQLQGVRTVSSGNSDHLPVVATRHFRRVRNNEGIHITITYRDIKSLNKEQFISSLYNAPWDCAFVFEDSNDVIDCWYNIFNDIVDEHLPFKEKRVKRRIQPKWFTNDIAQAIKSRDRLLNVAKQSKLDTDWSNFRKEKNRVTKLIRETKKTYFKDKVAENKQNPRKLWNLIKGLSKDGSSHEGVRRLIEGDESILEKMTIAETLNSFFINQQNTTSATLGSDLELTIDQSLASVVNGQFTIPHVTKHNISNLLLSIPVHKATGHDGISAKLLRIAAPAIAGSLSRVINHCIDNQSFPTKWKIAKVTPVFKGNGSRDDKNNYRPISVLPILSKLFEKHICEHLQNFLKDNDILHQFQSGFRKSHSTDTALIRLIDQLLMDLDKNRVSGLVFVDYKKAFDLVDHHLLLKKLETYGVLGNELNLISDYLHDRLQYVDIDGHRSSSKGVVSGVPQGSILGPVLFLLFINDLPTSTQQSVLDIYADDTTMSYSSDVKDGLETITSALQEDLKNVSAWSDRNNMVINNTKTKCILVTGKRLNKKLSSLSLQLTMQGTMVDQVNNQKLLGVTLDQSLNFDEHIQQLCKKLSQRIAVLRKIRKYLPIGERILYYNAMIKQTMMYGSIVWSSCSIENVNKVFKLQKRAARVILAADTRTNSVDLFKKLNWIPFYDEVKINKCTLVFKRFLGDCPPYLTNILKTNRDIHSRVSRHGSYNLVCPRFSRETEGGRSFAVSASRLWNSIPNSLKTCSSVSSFRNNLFNYYKDSYKDIRHFTYSR